MTLAAHRGRRRERRPTVTGDFDIFGAWSLGNLQFREQIRYDRFDLFFVFEIAALFGQQLLLLCGQFRGVQQTDRLEMVFDNGTQLGHQRRHVDTARLEVTATRIEHGLHFVNHEGDIAALAEHGRHDARQRHDPLEMIHGLGVDKDLERTA